MLPQLTLIIAMTASPPPQRLCTRAAILRSLGCAVLQPVLPPLSAVAEDLPEVLYLPPEVKGASSREAMILAKHLKSKGAKLYGTYWCGNCERQKAAFGAEAASLLNYVECAEDGFNTKRSSCLANGVPGYPAWEIDGELFTGKKELEDLAVLSGCCEFSPGFCGDMTAEEMVKLGKEAFRR